MHSKTNNIPIKYHFLWEQVAENNIRVEYVGTKEQVENIFTKTLPHEDFEYLCQRLGFISTSKWMLFEFFFECLSYMSYMYTRKHHKRKVQSGGEAPDGKIPLPLMKKGERFIRCRGQRHGSRESMSDMTSVLHDMISVLHQSISINAKGGGCWLRLVFIDVNPWRKFGSTKFWVMDPSLFDVKMTHYCLVMVDKKYKWMNSKLVPLWWKPSWEGALRIELS